MADKIFLLPGIIYIGLLLVAGLSWAISRGRPEEARDGSLQRLLVKNYLWVFLSAMLFVWGGEAYRLACLTAAGIFLFVVFLLLRISLGHEPGGSPRRGAVIALFAALTLLVSIHGYAYASSAIQVYTDRCGAYGSLDAAIAGNAARNGSNVSDLDIRVKHQNSPDNPRIWYVIAIDRSYNRAGQPGMVCGGSFYIHARPGWFAMPEGLLNSTGYLDLWMSVYGLYGG